MKHVWIIELWGVRPLARKLGHKYATTVGNWKSRGVIPLRSIKKVVALARRENINLDYVDFFEKRTKL